MLSGQSNKAKRLTSSKVILRYRKRKVPIKISVGAFFSENGVSAVIFGENTVSCVFDKGKYKRIYK
jgi:hypothetical protein